MRLGARRVFGLGVLGAALMACGSDPATDGNGGGGGAGPAVDNSGGPVFGDGTSGGNGSGGGSGGGGTTPVPACATATAQGQALPVHLVFMYDRSGSMGQQGKWAACKAALDAYFGSTSVSNVSASLAFFPNGSTTSSMSNAAGCQASAYSTPVVSMTAIPSASFQSAIASTGPSGGTPTLPAITGAIDYAKTVAAQLGSAGKVAIVLVTDGDPNDCSSTPQNVAAQASTVASTIPTYVIGVGASTTNMNTIAQGGGTKQAILVSTTNPQQTTADLTAALGQITNALGCAYTIPQPPQGLTLDYNAVNVAFTPAGGQPTTLSYNATCAGGTGWHYDNTTAPTQIQLCDGSCTAIRTGGANGKVEVQFGCQTQAGPGGGPGVPPQPK
jgi:hypothetical protein